MMFAVPDEGIADELRIVLESRELGEQVREKSRVLGHGVRVAVLLGAVDSKS